MILSIKYDGIRSQHHQVGLVLKENVIQGANLSGIAVRYGSNGIPNFIQSNLITINPAANGIGIYGISLWDIPGQYVNGSHQTNVVFNELEWDTESTWGWVSLYDIRRVGGLTCSNNQANVVQNHKNFGYWLEQNNKMIVSGNQYQNDVFGGVAHTVGYSINGSPNGLICCNTSSNARFGFGFSGASPNRWDGNQTINDHFCGLLLYSESIMGQQYFNQNLFVPTVQSNEWLATYSSGQGASTPNSGSTLQASLIYYNSDFPTTATLNNHQYGSGDPEGHWFKPWPDSDPAFCESEESICSSIIPPVHLTDADEHASRGYFIDSLSGNIALNWEMQRNLLHNIAADSTLLGTNAIIDSFYTASDSLMVSDVVYFERYLDSIRQYSASDQERIAEYQDSMLILDAAIADLDTLIAYASTLEDTLQIFNDKYTILLSINHWLNEMLEMDSLQLVRQTAGISELTTQIGSWSPANLVDSNYFIGYQHYLEVLGDPEHLFDSSALALLHTVADQCPQFGGNIVYLCRTMIQNQYPEMYWDDEILCVPDTSRSVYTIVKDLSDEALGETILVFPNPASDQVHIQSRVKADKLELQVFNTYGAVFFAGHINSNTIKSIPVDTWPDGLYAFVFTDKTNRKFVSKVAIIRN